jgi:cytochrome c oxidase cbb3-type subunit III
MRGIWRLGAGVLACAWLSALMYAQAPTAPPAPANPGAQGPSAGPRPAGQGGGGQRQGPQRRPGESPAAERRPATVTPQKFPPAQIEAGRARFGAQCGFCHGRDATGGESGPDLTRSPIVAEDVRGNKIGPAVRAGRPDKGMPAFALSGEDMAAIVAFIHDAKIKAESSSGGRRSVDVADLQTGNAEAGRQFFNGPGGCATCHATNLVTVGARYQGLGLLQRMLYPGSGGRGAGGGPTPPTLTVTPASGAAVTGKLVYRDEFAITLMDADGWMRSWPLKSVRVTGEEPLRAHVEALGKYTDEDMHNVFAYLQTLK